jgi:hypothetical protein
MLSEKRNGKKTRRKKESETKRRRSREKGWLRKPEKDF